MSRIIMKLFGLIFLLGLAWYSTSSSFDSDKSDKSDGKCEDVSSCAHVKKTSVHGKPLPLMLWWDRVRDSVDGRVDCGDVSCQVTTDRSRLHKQKNIMMVMFYGSEFALRGLPFPRRPNHLWAILLEDFPEINWFLFQRKEVTDLFNVSCTFKRESDYPEPTMWLKNQDDLFDITYVLPLADKNRLRKNGLAPVVFISSDCKVPTDRSRYIRLLMRYIYVDSYGGCENNKQLPNNLRKTASTDVWDSEYKRFLAQYKFIIAFENVVCDDYITDKLWRSFHLGIVPIVFGSPKLKDFLPAENSAVVISDFDSIEDVVKQIRYLDENDDEYEKYLVYKKDGLSNSLLQDELERREWGPGKRHKSLTEKFQCQLCHKLHDVKKMADKGLPLPAMRTANEHFSCPPPRDFDGLGKYEFEHTFLLEQLFAEFYAKGLLYYLERGVNATKDDLYRFVRELDEITMIKMQKTQLH